MGVRQGGQPVTRARDELDLDDFTDYGMVRRERPPAPFCPECRAGLCRCDDIGTPIAPAGDVIL